MHFPKLLGFWAPLFVATHIDVSVMS